MPIRRKRILAIVEQLLDSHGISEPPVPVDRIVLAQGVRIYPRNLKGDISGFLYRDSKESVIGINTHHPRARQKFTLAHELGHLLLHKEAQLHVDRVFEVKLRSDLSSKGVDVDEMEANLFAAELLMPRRFLMKHLASTGSTDISDDTTLGELAKNYGVSLQALMIRLTALGYVNPRSEVSLIS